MQRRTILIAALIAAAVAGAVVAVVLAGGDDDDDGEGAATVTAAPTETETETETEETATETTPAGPTPAERRDARAVERTVAVLVEATELSDGARACAVIVGGRGSDIEACARAAGIDLRALPTSDEFSIDDVRLRRSTAVVRLSNGTTVTARRVDGRWKVAGVRAASL